MPERTQQPRFSVPLTDSQMGERSSALREETKRLSSFLKTPDLQQEVRGSAGSQMGIGGKLGGRKGNLGGWIRERNLLRVHATVS